MNAAEGVWALCLGCDAAVEEAGYCARCAEELRALNGLYAEWERKLKIRMERDGARRARWAAWKKRLSPGFYAAASVAMLWWFLWETRGWWLALLWMWFGGDQ